MAKAQAQAQAQAEAEADAEVNAMAEPNADGFGENFELLLISSSADHQTLQAYRYKGRVQLLLNKHQFGMWITRNKTKRVRGQPQANADEIKVGGASASASATASTAKFARQKAHILKFKMHTLHGLKGFHQSVTVAHKKDSDLDIEAKKEVCRNWPELELWSETAKLNSFELVKAMAEAEVVPEVEAEAAFLHWSMLITKHTKWRDRYKGRGRHDGGGSGSGGGGGGGGSIAVSAICVVILAWWYDCPTDMGVKGKEHNNNAPPIPPPLPLLPSPPPPPLPPPLAPPPSYWCYTEAHWANCMEEAKFPVMFLVKEEVLTLQNMLASCKQCGGAVRRMEAITQYGSNSRGNILGEWGEMADTWADAPKTLEGAYRVMQAVRRRSKVNEGGHPI
ncbi:hypothetical protein C8R45DRAFT_936337 [Mycena sanguinolenta]|nr:hypothetical protein C8R45DRAFT_936337 [Mycena sanguinolenta]